MTWFDLTVLAVLGISILLGVMRGLVKELMALASWVLAFVAARQFAASAATFLPQSVQPAELRLAIGFVVLLLASLVVLWLVGLLLTEAIQALGLSSANRSAGALFGLLRGLFIVVVAVMVGGLTSLPESPGWRNAWLSPPLVEIALTARAWLPDSVKANVKYDRD